MQRSRVTPMCSLGSSTRASTRRTRTSRQPRHGALPELHHRHPADRWAVRPIARPLVHGSSEVDEGGHGTHVAGMVGAALNGMGTTGVAPNVTLVNLRAGQDSGFFFLFETLAALTYAADNGIDVVNMSFFTDPWLFNCRETRRTLRQRSRNRPRSSRRPTCALDYASTTA